MRILAVLGHCDDEAVFGWPLFQEAARHELALLTCCASVHKGEGPSQARLSLCEAVGVIPYVIPLLDNQFYRLPMRHAEFTLMEAVERLQGMIRSAVDDFKPDVIFTHNPWGEYGHGDHRLVFDIVARMNFPMLLTDICITNKCHPSSEQIPLFYRPLFQNPWRSCTLDEAWYEKMKNIYEKSNAWTWGGHEPVRKAKLYLFQ